VTLGAILGHALCTGLAVLGGRMIAQKISVKTGTSIFELVMTIEYFHLR
jgi:Ca2+/H+ antiporter, TMEM165/GDT1 family